MEPNLSIAARTALASGLVTLVMAATTVAVHRVMRWNAGRHERSIQELARDFALCFTGGVAIEQLRKRAEAAPGEAFWGAIQRFTDNIGGDEWRWLSRQLQGLPQLAAERRRLERGRPWRRAVAARRLGLVDDPLAREALRAALERGGPEVRLPALLSLSRLQDPSALRWLLQHAPTMQDVSPSILLAILKRFGAGFAPEILAVLDQSIPAGRLAIAAAEALGAWHVAQAGPALERLLRSGGLEERTAAARALGHLGVPAATEVLIDALDDPEWQVRAQAARSLGRLGGLAALEPLESAVTDPAWWVRRNACYALVALGTPGTTALRRVAAWGEDRYARDMAAEALQAHEWEQQSPGGMGRVG
jgi:HEAT repeat protein